MKRNWDMSVITDGKKYSKSDVAKLGCDDCSGCSACCHNMGTSIQIDPYDIYQLTVELHMNTQELMDKYMELNLVDGVILPNLKMKKETLACGFLNKAGRCSIHRARPGICRLFPLGRLYEDGSFTYFLQKEECKKEERTEVLIEKWLGINDLEIYEKYIADWHYFVKEWQERIQLEVMKQQKGEQTQLPKQMMMYLLLLFYNKMYDEREDFYKQFYVRLKTARELLQQI